MFFFLLESYKLLVVNKTFIGNGQKFKLNISQVHLPVSKMLKSSNISNIHVFFNIMTESLYTCDPADVELNQIKLLFFLIKKNMR